LLALVFSVPTPVRASRAAAPAPGNSTLAHPVEQGERPGPAQVRVAATPEIWQVEKSGVSEVWSNGLRIDNQFVAPTHPRSYRAFPAGGDDTSGQRSPSHIRTAPAGIVFHTTESLQLPFEEKRNAALKTVSHSMLEYVKSKRAYNFLIDRFGRVFRVVPEGDAANHSGNSFWADSDWVYINLNESFIAVAFETSTVPGQQEAAVSPAQVRSAAMLTEMLRERYGIPPGNCVTHAQVSVNGSNLQIGYHVDWASSFPFEQVGLPDNYALPLPAVAMAGFDFASDFEHNAGARVYREAELGRAILRERAEAAGVGVAQYRTELRKRYRGQLVAVLEYSNRSTH